MDIALSITATLVLIIVNGFFSMSEMALVNAKRPILEHDAEEGDRKARAALELSEDSGEFLAAIQVAITLVGFFASAAAATNLSAPFAAWMMGLGLPGEAAHVIAPILITLVVSYVSIVIGELVPKRIALADCEGVSKRVSGFLGAFTTVAKPLVWLTSASANGISKLLHIRSAEDRQNISEEEIRYMVSDADELSEEEKSMIHEVIELGDTKAREVMIPRVDMDALEDTTSLSDVLARMRETGHSRIPIYHEDVDDIVGIAHIKDVITPIVDDGLGSTAIKDHLREASFVPDTKEIIPLLSEMQLSHEQMAIVVDEWGGTAGLITLEDIVEEIVGEIEDEFDPDNKFLTRIGDRSWLVDGRFPIDDAIELGWPIEDSDEYETVAGFILDEADGLPEPGDVIEKDGWQFRVQTVRGQRIALMRVRAPEPKPEVDAGAESEGGLLSRILPGGASDEADEKAQAEGEPS